MKPMRTKAVYAGGEVLIPAEFWKDVGEQMFHIMCKRDQLSNRLKRKLFAMLGQPVPQGPVQIMVWNPDLEELLDDILAAREPQGHA